MSQFREDFEIIDYCSIRPNRISFYSQSNRPRRRSIYQIMNEVHLRNNAKSEAFSFKSKQRINNALAWLLEFSKNERYYSYRHKRFYDLKVNFITLTLASKQLHSDNVIKTKLLNQFLTELRTRYKVENYVWCAEPQKNGNIHFHITANKYVPWWELKETWNRIQDKLGYVQRFFDVYGHYEPNSTDVHSVRKIRKLPGYLYKYFTKESDVERPACAGATNNKGIQGKRWGLSTSLSRAKSCITLNYCSIKEDADILYHKFKKKIVNFDYAQVLYLPFSYIRKMGLNSLVSEFDQYKSELLGRPQNLVPI